jgi:hypothetical protein
MKIDWDFASFVVVWHGGKSSMQDYMVSIFLQKVGARHIYTRGLKHVTKVDRRTEMPI